MPGEPPTSVADQRTVAVRRCRRLAVWLALGLLAIGGGVAYRAFWLARPMGSGPAGPAVDRHAFAAPWTDRQVLLVGVGDSIIAGLGARTAAHGYFSRLVACPPDEHPDMAGLCLSAVLPHLSTLNIAVSGSNSLDHVQAVQEHLPRQAAETLGLVVLTTGGNDLIHWYGRQPPREGAMYGATLAQAEPWIEAFAQTPSGAHS